MPAGNNGICHEAPQILSIAIPVGEFFLSFSRSVSVGRLSNVNASAVSSLVVQVSLPRCLSIMTSLAAFSLVAGILQVLDISFRAVKECREIYNDGYVAAHRDAAELAEALGGSA